MSNGQESGVGGQESRGKGQGAGVRGQESGVQVVIEPGLEAKFATAKTYYTMSKLSMAQSVAFMILTGFELKRLRKEIGETRGGDHKTKSINVDTFASVVEKILGISKMTAWRFEQMADAAKKRLPALDAKTLMETPLGDLPELKQRALLNAVTKVTDGQTAQQCMWDWGIAKLPQGSGLTGGYHPGTGKKLSPEEQLELARNLAREDWLHHQRSLLFGYRLNFALLSDTEIEGQIAALELAIAARRRWLKQARGKRDPVELDSWFKAQVGEVIQKPKEI